MKRVNIGVFVLLLLSIGCGTSRLVETGNTAEIAPLIGMSVQDAFTSLCKSSTSFTCDVYEKPDGVARGWRIASPDGSVIHLYFARTHRAFADSKVEWIIDDLLAECVVGVHLTEPDGQQAFVGPKSRIGAEQRN